MKYLFVLLLATSTVFAADGDAKKAVESYYHANEFSVDVFGYLRTRDFDNERTGIGLGLNYFYTQNWGVGIEGSAGNIGDIFVESTRLNVLYRIPINRSAVYVFAGAGADFCVPPIPSSSPSGVKEDDGEVFAFDFGVGIEHRFSKHLGVFGDVRFDKPEHQSAQAIGRVGVRIPF